MNEPIFSNTYQGLPLNPTAKGTDGFDPCILEAIRQVMNASLAEHKRVLAVMMTLTYPSAVGNMLLSGAVIPDGNDVFKYFLNQYIPCLRRKGYGPRYIWCREQDSSLNSHFHLWLFLDRNKIQRFGSMDEINRYWSQALANYGIVARGCNTSGLIDRGVYTQNNKTQYWGMEFSQNHVDEYEEVYRRTSYLAKVYSKETGRPSHTHRWGCSQY